MRFQPPRGMRDLWQDDFSKREYVCKKIKEILERYGFEFVEPSTLENFEVLAKKAGDDIEKEIYCFKDKAGRKLGLRFDLTVGMARMVASKKLPRPIKLACISNMFRYDEPQFARYREFWQWDIEIFGVGGEEADAEIIAVMCDIFGEFNLDYEIRISNRKLIEGFLIELGIKKKLTDIFRIIDKLSKKPKNELRKEFEKLKLSKKQIDSIFKFCSICGDEKILNKIEVKNKLAIRGLEELKRLFNYLKNYEVNRCIIDLSIVRGIDYYTGLVYEAWIKGDERLGAIAAGGRFDDLVGLYGQDMPACGTAGGIERLLLSLKEIPEIGKTKFLVVYTNDKLFDKGVEIAQRIRRFSSCDIDLSKRNLKKQMNYANSRRIPFVIIVGERELKNNCVRLRDMKTGDEKEIRIGDLEEELSRIINNVM